MQNIIRQMLIAVVVLVVITVIVTIVGNSAAVRNLEPTSTPWPTSVPPSGAGGPTRTPTGIVARAQKLTGGSTVVIASVSAPSRGWVSIHADSNNSPTATILGYVAVPAGLSTNVAVRLTNTSAITSRVWAVLHVDAGRVGVFEYPGPDGLVYTSGKNYVRAQIALIK
jgi:hypothetical protein